MIRTKHILAILPCTVSIFLCVGCGNPTPVSGIVQNPPSLAEGSLVPDIPFTTSDGKYTSLWEIRQPITIVAFVETTIETWSQVNSEVANLHDKFSRYPVTIVQVSLIDGASGTHSSREIQSDVKTSGPVVLCDGDRIAWNLYGKPAPGTAVLLDDRRIVVEVSNIRNIRSLTETASILAWQEMNSDDTWD
jgi:hypothetical protein